MKLNIDGGVSDELVLVACSSKLSVRSFVIAGIKGVQIRFIWYYFFFASSEASWSISFLGGPDSTDFFSVEAAS